MRRLPTRLFVAVVVSLVSVHAAAQLDPPGTVVYRVNSGGPAYTDSFGNTWSADAFFNTGKIFAKASTVSGTTDSFLYEDERYDPSSDPDLVYSFPVTSGVHNVRLYFAEIYVGNKNPGDRIFHVDIEGARHLSNFDIAAEVGFRHALIKDFTVDVTDGSLDIAFARVVENPKISAIAIAAAGEPVPPEAFVIPGAVDFGVAAAGIETPSTTVEIMNSGGETLDVSSVTLSGANPGEFGTNAAPPYSIAPGDSVVFNVTFAPTSVGLASAELVIASNDPSGAASVQLNGEGIAPLPPEATPAPASVDFGALAVGLSDAEQITVSNTGQETLEISAIGISGASAGSFQTDATPPYTLQAGENAVFEVTFAPTSGGILAAQLDITSNDPNSPAVVMFSGEGVAPLPPAALVTPDLHNFGQVLISESSAALIVAVENVGEQALEIGSVSVAGANPADFTTTAAPPYSIVPGDFITFEVTFTPTAAGARAADIEIASNDPNTPAIIGVSGEGVEPVPPTALVSPDLHDFGQVIVNTTSPPTTITVSNEGDLDLEINAVDVSGTNASEFATTAVAPYTIAPGDFIAFDVTFTPADVGARTAQIDILSNDPAGPHAVALSGQGVEPVPPTAELLPLSHDFGQKLVGTTSAPQTFTVTNTGEQDLTIDSISIVGADATEFSHDATTGQVLAPMESMEFGVVFEPTVEAVRSAQLQVVTNDPNSPAVADLTGEGITTPAALYRVNAGGPSVTDTEGNVWSGDSGFFNTGKVYAKVREIAGTEFDVLYQTERYDPASGQEMMYTFLVDPGDYMVRLHFAEIYAGLSGAGQRLFAIQIEDQVVLDNFDIITEVGFAAAAMKEFNATVNDGNLNITFLHRVENPKVSGIEIFGGAVDPTASVEVNPLVVSFGDVVVSGTGSDVITITNTGDLSVTVDSIQIAGPDAAHFAHDAAANYTLAPSEFVSFNIDFSPAVNGPLSASLVITTSADATPVAVALSGNGVSPGGVNVAPVAVDFGSVNIGNTSPARIFTVTNNDIASHEVSAIELGGADSAEFVISQAPALPILLAAGQSTTVDVAFAPSSGGAKAAQLTLHLDDGTPEHEHVAADLTGVGFAGAVAVARVNAGGPEYVDPRGNTWLADDFYVNTGKKFSTNSSIAGTDMAPLYQTERYDESPLPELRYTFFISNGTYQVRLHFAEIFAGAASVGNRVFDVLVEDQIVLPSFDIYATAGFLNAHVEEFTVDVVDGNLAVELVHITENPKISAIEVFHAGVVETDDTLFDWGHVAPNTAGPTKTVTLTNVGTATVILNDLSFTRVSGRGDAFFATVAGMTYDGSPDGLISYPINVALAPGESTAVDLDFTPLSAEDNEVVLEFTGNSAPVVLQLRGTGEEAAGHPFLHVVINVPSFVVDFDGDGTESVALEGSLSHTHEFGHELTLFEWRENGQIFSSDPDAVVPFALGDHQVSLTIYDDNAPPETLTDTAGFSVVSAGAVPGAFARYYQSGTATPNDLLDAVPASADFAERIPTLEVFSVDGKVGGSPFIGNVMVRLDGVLEMTQAGSYAFSGVGGNETRLFVDGAPVTGPLALSAGPHSIEGRFAVANSGETPLQILMSIDGGLEQAIPAADTTHDETVLPPVINSMPTSGLPAGGSPIKISGAGFFPSDQVVVNWDGVAISDVTASFNEINMVTPPGVGTVEVFVQTPNGQSNTKLFTYDSDGPAPIIFNMSQLVGGLDNPTRAVWGPDHRLYVGTLKGKIHAYTFDDNYNVLNVQNIDTLTTLSNHEILGLAVSPFDSPGPVKLYVAHSELFANGGACFEGVSPYSGRISVLTGPDFDTIEPVVTSLPVSNHDHGVNGIAFDNNGDLLVAVGGNTNAGIVDCNIGGIDESPYSAAILKVHITDPDFNGDITYFDSTTCIENDDQVFGHLVEPSHGTDITVFASGIRNAFDFEFTTAGAVYATDNSGNKGFGDASTGPDTQVAFPSGEADELIRVDVGRYYGHPSRPRGRTDQRQNVFLSAKAAAGLPGNVEAALLNFSASTNGIFEYRASTFNNAMRGNLIAQQWNGKTYRVVLAPDGKSVTLNDVMFTTFAALDVIDAPGGVIIGVDLSGDEIIKAVPDDQSVSGLTVYDIFPWRAPSTGGQEFVIGGANFGSLADTTVTIAGIPATVTEVSPTRIKGVVPVPPNPTTELVDVVVNSGGSIDTLPAAFRYLKPAAGPAPGVAATIVVDPPSGAINASTFTQDSYLVSNDSTNGAKIKRIRIDISTAIFRDLLFDPFGTGGDTDAKGFQLNSKGGSDFDHFVYFNPHDGGFDVLELVFNGFDPGEQIGFSIDNDPSSTKGTAGPGPGHSGSVSGLELVGATYYIEFDDDSVLTGQLFQTPGSIKGSANTLKAVTPPDVNISSPAIPCKAGALSTANQTVTVSGPPGTDVRLIVVESALFVDASGGFDIDPFESNTALGVTEHTAVVGAGGTVEVPITLTKSHVDGGYNIVSAAAVDAQGDTGRVSETLVMQYTP